MSSDSDYIDSDYIDPDYIPDHDSGYHDETKYLHPCGAEETSTTEIRQYLLEKCKHELSYKFGNKVDKESISIDCDAISVIITTPDMTEVKRDAIREFLLMFGSESSLRCGIPQGATGHGKINSIFSCYGKKCQHLPKILDGGEEMLVIDVPCKVALHSSCKEKVIEALRQRDFYLFPANDNGNKETSICFLQMTMVFVLELMQQQINLLMES